MYIQKYYNVIRVIKDEGATPLYIENVSDSDGIFKLNKRYSPSYTPNLIYRIDDGEWLEYDVASLPSITVPSRSKIYFRGDNPNGFGQSAMIVYYFNFNQSYNIGGYITSLLALDNFKTITDMPFASFPYLFYNQTTLLNIKDLIINNIINVNAHGFANCFNGCTSLSEGLNFSTISNVGGNSFSNCFQNCTSLRTVYAPNITTWDENIFSNWLKNASPTGIIYKPANLTIPTGSTSGVPTGWTTVDY